MTNKNVLPVHERFHSFQGEGVHAGRSAFFIRTYGCPLHCPWCDAAGTWHAGFAPEGGPARVTVDVLVREAVESRAEFIVLTGGEPMIHGNGVASLLDEAGAAGIPVHLETSGAFITVPVGRFQWITLSPKEAMTPHAFWIHAAHELKLIVDNTDAIRRWEHVIRNAHNAQAIFLNPEWSQRNEPDILRLIVDTVKERGGKFRAGWQLHKLYMADAFDKRSAPLVPLGGDPAKGF